jgi:hypothetical protein
MTMLDEDKKVGAGAGSGSLSDPAVVAAMATMLGVSDFTQAAACGPVKGFQLAYNNAGNVPALSVDGSYGAETAAAAALVAGSNGGGNVPAPLTSGWPNCGGGVQPPPVTPVTPVVPSSGMPNWLKILIYILIAGGVVAGSIWLYRYYGKRQLAGASERRRPRRRGKRSKKR